MLVSLVCKHDWCPLHRTLSLNQVINHPGRQALFHRFDQLFLELNTPNAHISQMKISETRQTQNVNFRFMPNAFQILKPIQRSSKHVCQCFLTQVQKHLPKMKCVWHIMKINVICTVHVHNKHSYKTDCTNLRVYFIIIGIWCYDLIDLYSTQSYQCIHVYIYLHAVSHLLIIYSLSKLFIIFNLSSSKHGNIRIR